MRIRTRRSVPSIATLIAMTTALTGCDPGCEMVPYTLQLAEGQFGIQGHTQPIEDVLAAGTLSEKDAAKLRLLVKAREYAVNVIGLDAGSSYTTFYDTGGDPLAWNLSAAPRDALRAKTWSFPIVGVVPYLAFFDERLLHQFEDQLIADGYDTMIYELDAYSTLGYFEDPVRSPMLRRNELSLSETIIHELLHNTIWRADDTNFNESLANFVGRTGAVEFLRAEFGDASGWPQLAEQVYADTDVVNAFLAEFYAELAAYYGQPRDYDTLVGGREAVFQAARDRYVSEVQPTLNRPDALGYYAELPTNNAWMLANYRYNLDLGVFRQVFDAVGRSWLAALDVFRAAARGADPPFDYLHNWLAAQGP